MPFRIGISRRVARLRLPPCDDVMPAPIAQPLPARGGSVAICVKPAEPMVLEYGERDRDRLRVAAPAEIAELGLHRKRLNCLIIRGQPDRDGSSLRQAPPRSMHAQPEPATIAVAERPTSPPPAPRVLLTLRTYSRCRPAELRLLVSQFLFCDFECEQVAMFSRKFVVVMI